MLGEDYVRTAQAKGLPERIVRRRYILRNSLTPLISIFGGLIPFIFGAQLLIEYASGWDGLGSLFLSAASFRDYTLLMAILTFIALICVASSFVADLLHALADPRVRETAR